MDNIYLPKIITLESSKEETPEIKSFEFNFENEDDYKNFKFIPGQFIELSIFGYGEAPFSIVSCRNNKISISVKKTGTTTTRLFELKKGGFLGLRGPFGNGFPIEKSQKNNILIIGGGIGLAPLKSFITYILSNRENYGKLTICYGARTDIDLVYKEELAKWPKEKNVDLHLTVDCPKDKSWQCNIGSVAALLSKLKINPDNTSAFICGPPVMIPYVLEELKKHKIEEQKIFISMERMMKCGAGKCGHCTMGEYYVCQDGPVFTLEQIQKLLTSR